MAKLELARENKFKVLAETAAHLICAWCMEQAATTNQFVGMCTAENRDMSEDHTLIFCVLLFMSASVECRLQTFTNKCQPSYYLGWAGCQDMQSPEIGIPKHYHKIQP